MATKFVRGIIFNSGSTTARASYMLKFIYELWGYCIYGGNALATPGFGALAGSTTIAVASNGQSLPQATINVASTAAAPTSGTIFVHTSTGSHAVAYTGKTGTTFTGCTGGTGTMSTGNVVNSFAATSIPGNFLGASTIIASGSNGLSLPQATINVVSTSTFPTSGTINVYTSQGTQIVSYTGVTATSFTGCTSGLGTMSTGGNVTSSSLLSIGSDGYTNATTIFRADGYTDFYSTTGNFISNMVGKQLVAWKSGSNTSEDGIYNIIAFKSPNNIVININNGGTPSGQADGYRPTVTTRSSINYRIVDIGAAGATTGIADGNFVIFQLDPTGVNTGQANSQIQLLLAASNLRFDGRMSPNGSWTGTAFGVDASGAIAPNNVSSTSFYNGATSNGFMSIFLVGDKSFLIGHSRDQTNNHGSGYHFHFEIPERLYSATADPNPLVMSLNGYHASANQQFVTAGTTYGYGGGFTMRCNDGVYRNYRGLAKATTGDGNAAFSGLASAAGIFGTSLTDLRVAITPVYGSVMSSQATLGLPGVAGQFSYVRCRLKTVRYANNTLTRFTRFDSGGDFLLLTNGLAVVWDKTVLPLTIFPFI